LLPKGWLECFHTLGKVLAVHVEPRANRSRRVVKPAPARHQPLTAIRNLWQRRTSRLHLRPKETAQTSSFYLR
jgi:hypothetical protein